MDSRHRMHEGDGSPAFMSPARPLEPGFSFLPASHSRPAPRDLDRKFLLRRDLQAFPGFLAIPPISLLVSAAPCDKVTQVH